MEIKVEITKSELTHLIGLMEEIDNFILSGDCTYKAKNQLEQLVNLTATLADKICQQSHNEVVRGDRTVGISSDFDISFIQILGAYDIPPYNNRRSNK